MPFVEMERKRSQYLTDEVMQITWYVVYGSIHEQKNAIIYKMLPTTFENAFRRIENASRRIENASHALRTHC